MSRTRIHRLGGLKVAAVATLAVTALLSGCNSSKSKASAAASSTAASTASTSAAAPATPATSAPAVATSAAAVPSDTASATTVKATGGGKFCQQVASSINASAALTGDDTASIKTEVQQYQVLKTAVLKSAPNAIKGDLATIFGATDKLYAALAAANYDYTKLDPSALTSLDTPAITAAEKNLDTYLKTVCGIDEGSLDGSAAPAASS